MNRKHSFRMFFVFLAGLVMLTAISCSDRLSEPAAKETFDGKSSDLKDTQIVATLDEPIASDKNAIWCASFQSAWKELQNDVVKEAVVLDGGGPQVDALNAAADPKPTIPSDCLYSAAGWIKDDIVVKIQGEMKKRFPGKQLPEFDKSEDLVAIAYAYLEANVKFTLPYFQNRSPLDFVSADGQKTSVQSFELPSSAEIIGEPLRAQPALLFAKWDESFSSGEFAVDLDRHSKPSQIVVAVVEPGKSLAETLQIVEKKVADFKTADGNKESNEVKVLCVPDMCWRISHSYDEFIDKHFKNKGLQNYFIAEARQDIAFRLDRSGAELKSEAVIEAAKCAESLPPCVANRPFLVYMKKRGADAPYFVMWVANAELLTPWAGK